MKSNSFFHFSKRLKIFQENAIKVVILQLIPDEIVRQFSSQDNNDTFIKKLKIFLFFK